MWMTHPGICGTSAHTCAHSIWKPATPTHRREIHALKTEIERYRQRYEEDSKMLKEITGNKDALEKVARERYLMKQENEDIFVFQKDTEKE